MSKDVLREEIIWAKVIPEIEKHIAKFDAEFQREWEARVGLKVTRQSHKGTDPSEETSTAKAALDKLVELGCEREKILCLLYMYVGGDPKKVGAVKKAFAWQRKHLLSTAQALNNTASEVNRAEANLAFMGNDVSNGPADAMRSYSELLKSLADTTFKDLASGRVSARDHHLVELANMIQRVTRARLYKEIAVLVDRVGEAYNPEFRKKTENKKRTYEYTTPEAIRNRINSYGPLVEPALLRMGDSARGRPKSKARIMRRARRRPPRRPH
jgi:hypothetical protein